MTGARHILEMLDDHVQGVRDVQPFELSNVVIHEEMKARETISLLREILRETVVKKKSQYEAMDRFGWFEKYGRPKIEHILSGIDVSDEPADVVIPDIFTAKA